MSQPAPEDATHSDHFPYAFSPEVALPRYLRFRAEGLPLRQSLWSGLSYLRKYYRGKYSAPPEEIAYFDAQRRLLRWLSQRGESGPRLGMVGDIMWLRDGWQDFLSAEVLAYLNGHEAVIGNMESPISSRFKVPRLLPDYFTYNSDPALITSFRRADERSTFSALATANNHCLDRGDPGLADTLAFLDAQKIPHSGVRRSADEKPYITFEAGGFRFGFYAACWGLNNPSEIRHSSHRIEVVEGLVPRVKHPVDLGRIREVLVAMASDGVDFRIVYLHWGYEFEFYPCPDVMQIGREVIRAGADVLVGSHPHVLQPLEVCFVNGYEQRYVAEGVATEGLTQRTGCVLEDGTGVPRKGLIAYSLGNFATTMYTLHCRTGMVLSLTLGRDPQTGRADWHCPEVQLVFNVHRDSLSRQRRLVLLESYLRERGRHGLRSDALCNYAAFLDRHLLGERET